MMQIHINLEELEEKTADANALLNGWSGLKPSLADHISQTSGKTVSAIFECATASTKAHQGLESLLGETIAFCDQASISFKKADS